MYQAKEQGRFRASLYLGSAAGSAPVAGQETS